MIYVQLPWCLYTTWIELAPLSPGNMEAILTGNNLKWIFDNEQDIIPNQISLKFVPRNLLDNKSALFLTVIA